MIIDYNFIYQIPNYFRTSYNMSFFQLFVPILVDGNQNNNRTLPRIGNGKVFKTEKEALNSIIDTIVSEDFISYEQYCDGFFEDFEPIKTKKEFLTMLKSEATSKEELDRLCYKYGDSCFNEVKGWTFEIVSSNLEFQSSEVDNQNTNVLREQEEQEFSHQPNHEYTLDELDCRGCDGYQMCTKCGGHEGYDLDCHYYKAEDCICKKYIKI